MGECDWGMCLGKGCWRAVGEGVGQTGRLVGVEFVVVCFAASHPVLREAQVRQPAAVHFEGSESTERGLSQLVRPCTGAALGLWFFWNEVMRRHPGLACNRRILFVQKKVHGVVRLGIDPTAI